LQCSKGSSHPVINVGRLLDPPIWG
jgi:hypothetical protein